MQEVLPNWPIIDFHTHFPYPWQRPDAGKGNPPKSKAALNEQYRIDEQKRRRQAWCFPEPEMPTQDWPTTAARWTEEIDKYGLYRVNFVTGGGNDLLAEIVASNPDHFTGFAHNQPWLEGAAAELSRGITELGFKGYKILAPTCPVPLEGLTSVWEVVEQQQIPVLIHFGILGGGGGIGHHPNINPLVLHNVAKAYPSIPFVVPHFGCGYPRELLQLCWVCPNVYVDTSSNNEWVNWMPYDLSVEDLFRRFYETIGPSRLIFGTDSSWFPRGFAVRYLLDQLRICYKLRIPESDMRLIFGGNAAKLLGVAIE